MTPGKILVIRGGAIGDFILTLPAIHALREAFPNAGLEILGYPKTASLALAAGLADRVEAIEARALASFFTQNGALDDRMADYFSQFTIIFSYLYDPDHVFQINVLRCADAQFVVCPHRPDESLDRHAAEVFAEPLQKLAIFHPNATPRLEVQPSNNGRRVMPPRTVALHPGSGSETKNWSSDNWMSLIRALLTQTDAHLLIVGGEAESDSIESLRRALPKDRCEFAVSAPLPDLARLFAQCAAYVGHDSGITHLAAAIGLPCVSLWNHTNLQIWAPRGRRVAILRGPTGINEIAPEAVLREVSVFLEPEEG